MRILTLDEIDSTNSEAKRLVRSTVSADHAGNGDASSLASLYGTIVTAKTQTEGRGRMGRSFYSPLSDSIYVSFILKPMEDPSKDQLITIAAAVAACKALEKTIPCRPCIKWINDILLDGKKICGILAEAIPHAIVLGIGININIKNMPEPLHGIAGMLEIGDDVRERLFNALVEETVRCTTMATDKTPSAPAALIDEYKDRSILIGKPVFVLRGDKNIPADAMGIAADGGLVVRYENGSCETLHSGEVSVRLPQQDALS